MFDFYQKRKLRELITSRFLQGGLLLMAVLIGISAFNRYTVAVEMAERREQVAKEAAALEERKEALQEKVDYLSNERGIEAELRRQFDVTLEGEQVVVIVEDEQEENKIQPLSTSTTNDNKAWYEFWR